jgi:GPN-loop GTPase
LFEIKGSDTKDVASLPGPRLHSTMRYAVLVTGPAGSGKSTFSNALITHLHTSRRTGNLVNLDPAAAPDGFEYEPTIDIRELISLQDVMDELEYGPNGGLVYCFE